jgi:hypothetical protein
VSFAEWVVQRYCVNKLNPGAEPDFHKKHRWGWMRLNETGEVTELVRRTIPGGFFFIFLGTCRNLLLKLGAVGWNIDSSYLVTEVTAGYADSTRFADIDFSAMRQKAINHLQKRWDAVHRISAGDTWIPFTEIRMKYPTTETYDSEIEDAASQEWFNQPTIQKLYQAHCTNDYTHDGLDLMLLPRTGFVQHFSKDSVLHYGYIIRNGELLTNPDEADLLAGLDDNALLTMAVVKC